MSDVRVDCHNIAQRAVAHARVHDAIERLDKAFYAQLPAIRQLVRRSLDEVAELAAETAAAIAGGVNPKLIDMDDDELAEEVGPNGSDMPVIVVRDVEVQPINEGDEG